MAVLTEVVVGRDAREGAKRTLKVSHYVAGQLYYLLPPKGEASRRCPRLPPNPIY
uniref:Uncharacterized protein n=1 Tax=Thermogemmatispora argillosa TaxID=2045280 RepID=A0A455SUE5_9CHLR|nr:hypothetical protein KTA_01960 [Thermogemmatispora argillosa]